MFWFLKVPAMRLKPLSREKFVCVEPGYVAEFKTIPPGETWIGGQIITVKKPQIIIPPS